VRSVPAHRSPGQLPLLDTGKPHAARVRNYLLGGKDNFAADREMSERLLRIHPGIAQMAREERRFLTRSVRYLTGEAGIRQFLDIGVGLPVGAATHQVAQRMAPMSRIVYVDSDPLVLAHARALLKTAPDGMTSYVEADLRDTEEILEEAAQTLDFGSPVAVMMLGVLGQIPDASGPGQVVERLVRALPPGSYLVLNDATDTSPTLSRAIAAYNHKAADSSHLRSPEQIAGFLDGLALVPPGVVSTSLWRPDLTEAGTELSAVDMVCGIGRKDL
jgi:S-adenosyl methyltransferase